LRRLSERLRRLSERLRRLSERCHLYALRLVLAAPSFFNEVLRVLPLVLAARSARHAEL
jgi:hypothetical protein